MQKQVFSPTVWLYIVSIFVVHLGYYIFLPYLAIVLSQERGLSVSQTGLVMAVSSLSLLLASLASGPLADRFGRKGTILIGLLLRTVGIAGYGATATFYSLAASASLVGAGGGLITPPAKAGISVHVTDGNQSLAFAWRGMAASLGVAIGPLVGTLLGGGTSPWLFATAAIVHFLLGIFMWFRLPADRPEEKQKRDINPTAFLRQILRDRPYIVFSVVTMLIWALFAQLAIAVPLRANEILPGTRAIGLLWTLSSIQIIVMQVPIQQYVTRHLHPFTALAAGSFILGIGLGSIAWATRFFHLLISTFIFTLGEMLIMPTVDGIVSFLAPQAFVSSYFGIASFIWGAGEGLGTAAGGQIIEWANATGNSQWTWFLFASVGMFLSIVISVLRLWPALASKLENRQAAETPRRSASTRPLGTERTAKHKSGAMPVRPTGWSSFIQEAARKVTGSLFRTKQRQR